VILALAPFGARTLRSAQSIYLVLPSTSAVGEGGELSDRELEAVAGGDTFYCTHTYGCVRSGC
jgi:hypothetical protein